MKNPSVPGQPFASRVNAESFHYATGDRFRAATAVDKDLSKLLTSEANLARFDAQSVHYDWDGGLQRVQNQMKEAAAEATTHLDLWNWSLTEQDDERLPLLLEAHRLDPTNYAVQAEAAIIFDNIDDTANALRFARRVGAAGLPKDWTATPSADFWSAALSAAVAEDAPDMILKAGAELEGYLPFLDVDQRVSSTALLVESAIHVRSRPSAEKWTGKLEKAMKSASPEVRREFLPLVEEARATLEDPTHWLSGEGPTLSGAGL